MSPRPKSLPFLDGVDLLVGVFGLLAIGAGFGWACLLGPGSSVAVRGRFGDLVAVWVDPLTFFFSLFVDKRLREKERERERERQRQREKEIEKEIPRDRLIIR